MMLPWSETFLSIQGEGPRAGRVCAFIRLGGCNLSCSWCDTPYTWDASRYDLRAELSAKTVQAIVAELPECDEVVITGGEPLIHQKNPAWSELLRLLSGRGIFICVETNGTIAPSESSQTFVGHFSISPKLPSAGPHRKGQNAAMARWPQSLKYRNTCLKIVVADAAEVQAAAALADEYGWPRWLTWVMPVGVTKEGLLKNFEQICDAAISCKVNVSQRLHVLAYGDRRGT